MSHQKLPLMILMKISSFSFSQYLVHRNIDFSFLFGHYHCKYVSIISDSRIQSIKRLSNTCTYFLSVCVFTGEPSAGCCSDAFGGSDRESFSRDTGLSSLQGETQTGTLRERLLVSHEHAFSFGFPSIQSWSRASWSYCTFFLQLI